jgi:hypothetical protein
MFIDLKAYLLEDGVEQCVSDARGHLGRDEAKVGELPKVAQGDHQRQVHKVQSELLGLL